MAPSGISPGHPARRQGALGARLLPGDPSEPPAVAYAIPRAVGGAVERNRLRRRLRATIGELEPELVPGGRYLVSVGPAVSTMSPADLRSTLRDLLRAVREVRR